MKDFCVEQNNNPENLAMIGEVLGAASVNLEGLCLTTCEEQSVIHLLAAPFTCAPLKLAFHLLPKITSRVASQKIRLLKSGVLSPM